MVAQLQLNVVVLKSDLVLEVICVLVYVGLHNWR